MPDLRSCLTIRVRAADVVLQTALRGMQIEEIEARVSEFDGRLDAVEQVAKLARPPAEY